MRARAGLVLLLATCASCATLLGIEDSTLAPDNSGGELAECGESSSCCIRLSGAETGSIECFLNHVAFESAEGKVSLSLGAGDPSDGDAPYFDLFAFHKPAPRPTDGAVYTDVEGTLDVRARRGESSQSMALDPGATTLTLDSAAPSSTSDGIEHFDATGTFETTVDGITISVTFAPNP
jgi:hypothetical protein